MYQIGEYVMKVNDGVCQVVDIVDMDGALSGKKHYVMVPRDDKNAKVFVPVDGKNGNVRNVMNENEAQSFIKSIPDIEEAWIENDKVREQEYKNAIKSGSPQRLVGIIKNIYNRNLLRNSQGKKNTTVDERYFKIAENILYSELAFALGKEKSDILELIFKAIQTSE